MKYTIMSILLIYFVLNLFGCCVDDIPMPNPHVSKDSTLVNRMIWSNVLYPDSMRYDPEKILYVDGKVYYTHIGSPNGTSLIRFDAITGEKEWVWHPEVTGGLFHDLVYSKGLFIVNHGKGMACVSEETGKSKWERDFSSDQVNTGLKIIGDYAYFSRNDGQIPFHDRGRLERINIFSGEDQNVWTIQKTDFDDYSPFLGEVESWLNPDGDTLALFYVSGLNVNKPGNQKTRIYAYNLNADTMYYEVDDVDPYALCNFRSPVIHDNFAFFNGGHTTYCYDLLNKELAWASDWPGFEGTGLIANTATKPAVVWPYVVVNPDSEDVLCYDAHDGDLIWKIENSSANTSDDMMYYKDHVYFTCFGDGRLYAINVQTGEEVWKHKSPFEDIYNHPTCNFTYENVAINEEDGLIYCHDEVFAMCFKAIE